MKEEDFYTHTSLETRGMPHHTRPCEEAPDSVRKQKMWARDLTVASVGKNGPEWI